MPYLTEKERLVLVGLGTLALVGFGVLIWQQRRAPIGVEPGPTPPSAQWDASLTEAKQIDLNRASAEELERLPQIGPELSQRIVEYRHAHGPFSTPQELQKIPGIGQKTFDALKEYVTVR